MRTVAIHLLLLIMHFCEIGSALTCVNEADLTRDQVFIKNLTTVEVPSNYVCAVHLTYDEAPSDIVAIDFFSEKNSKNNQKLPSCYHRTVKKQVAGYHKQIGSKFYKLKEIICRCKTNRCNEPELLLNYLPDTDIVHILLKRAFDIDGRQFKGTKNSWYIMLIFLIPSFLILFGVIGGSGVLIKKYGFRK